MWNSVSYKLTYNGFFIRLKRFLNLSCYKYNYPIYNVLLSSIHVMYICILIEWGGFECHIRVCGLCWSFSIPWNLIRFLPLAVRAGCRGSAPQLQAGAVASVAIFPATSCAVLHQRSCPSEGGAHRFPGVWAAPSLCCEPTATFLCECSIPYMLLFNTTQ